MPRGSQRNCQVLRNHWALRGIVWPCRSLPFGTSPGGSTGPSPPPAGAVSLVPAITWLSDPEFGWDASRAVFLFEHDLRANAFRVCREEQPASTFPDRALDCLFVGFVESKASQAGIAQLDWIALAIPGCINDPPGDHFVNDCWLPLVVKLLASGIECFAQDPGSAIVKDHPGLFDKRQDRRHSSSPIKYAAS